jgi:hypothetical protein
MYMPNLKTLKNERREFDSVTQARAFLEKLRKDQYFIYARPARWLIFEGEFRFKTRCPSDLGNNCYYIEHEEELVSKLRKEISKMFPAEAFELKASGGSSDGDVFVTVKCDRSLEEKFNLYDRWNRTGFGKWQPYHLTLNWYSKPHTLP